MNPLLQLICRNGSLILRAHCSHCRRWGIDLIKAPLPNSSTGQAETVLGSFNSLSAIPFVCPVCSMKERQGNQHEIVVTKFGIEWGEDGLKSIPGPEMVIRYSVTDTTVVFRPLR